jgi:CheY-like chemotaxis protein
MSLEAQPLDLGRVCQIPSSRFTSSELIGPESGDCTTISVTSQGADLYILNSSDKERVRTEEGAARMSSVRVLVIDDFEAWRRIVCLTLGKNPELQVVGEASDGLEAVHKAEELQPDLIVLDLGLPKMNGIEAARQIRKVAPNSKILFLSQESSADVVQEALSSGAHGYVLKASAGSDLMAAVAALLEGRQFVSSGLQIPPNSV